MYTHFLISAFLLHSCSARPVNDTEDCKCIPGELCWPSPADFTALNDTLSGRLIRGIPPASVCYITQPNYDETACGIVRDNWQVSAFHGADPISIGWPWWADNPCPPIYANGTSVNGDPNAGGKGCSIGAYPVYAVNATTTEHVQVAINFAREKNIRLNIKNTGHSLEGRSTALGSLSVWTHNMRGINYHETFEPESCPKKSTPLAFTIAAGERVEDIYEAANDHDVVVVAGSNRDVGVVGWFSGGGHGPISSSYGLGVDNVLQVKIVTADGTVRTANSCVNEELFWALRGGGGGTFGVIIEVTMRAYPSPQVSRQHFSMTPTQPDKIDEFWSLVAIVMAELPRLKEAGVQGYSNFYPPGTEAVSWTWGWGFDVLNSPNGTLESLFTPIAAKLDPVNGSTILYTSKISHYPDFFTAWNTTTDPEAVAYGGPVLGSRLLPASALTQNQEQLAQVLKTVGNAAQGAIVGPLLSAFLVANNNTEMIAETSVTPAWRDAVLHFYIAEGIPDWDTYNVAQPVLGQMTYTRVEALKSLAPDSGAYLNEADPFDPNWQYDFYGINYARLSIAKKSYDPDTVLWCISCVGSEEWVQKGSGQLCRA